MRLAWILPHLGIFGAIREVIEASNALVARGHTVTLYHPTGDACEWLPCRATVARLAAMRGTKHDVVISVSDWMPDMHKALDVADAKVKCIVVMGFPPTADVEAVWTGKRPAKTIGEDLQYLSIHKYHVLTDSSWQRDWLKAHVGVDSLPPLGGINLAQFRPHAQTHAKGYLLVGHTGDPRPRKGLDVIRKANALIKASGVPVRFDTYWGKNLTQAQSADLV